MGRSLAVTIAALIVIMLIGFNAVIVRPLGPIALLLIVAAVMIATIGTAYYFAWNAYQEGYKAGFEEGANQQYEADVDTKTRSEVRLYSSALFNKLLMMKDGSEFNRNYTYAYFLRLADSIAASAYVGNITLDDARYELKKTIYGIFSKELEPLIWSIQDAHKLDRAIGQERLEAGLSGLDQHIGSDGQYGLGYKSTNPIVLADGIQVKMYIGNIEIARAGALNNSIVIYGFDQVSNVFDILADVDLKVTIYYHDSTSVTLEDVVFYENGTGTESVSVEQLFKYFWLKYKIIYNDIETELVNYYNTLVELHPDPASLPPPPSVILPYDPEQLRLLSPEAQLALYQAYLKYLHDWATSNDTETKLNNIDPDTVKMVNGSVVINATVWVQDTTYTGLFIPIDVGGEMQLGIGLNLLHHYLYAFMISYDNKTMKPIMIPANSTIMIYKILDHGVEKNEITLQRTTARNYTRHELPEPDNLSPIAPRGYSGWLDWVKNNIMVVGLLAVLVVLTLAFISGGGRRVVIVR